MSGASRSVRSFFPTSLMAGTTTKSRDNAGHEQGVLRDLVVQFNKLVDDLELLRSHVATGTGVTATAAAALTAAKIGNPSGTAITS